MRKTTIVIALAALICGCGESVPQRSAQGGIMSGTEVERQRYSAHKNPVLAGNGQQEVVQSSVAPSTVAPLAPRPRTTGPTTAPASQP